MIVDTEPIKVCTRVTHARTHARAHTLTHTSHVHTCIDSRRACKPFTFVCARVRERADAATAARRDNMRGVTTPPRRQTTGAHARTHARSHVHSHARSHAHIRTHARTHARTCTRTQMHTLHHRPAQACSNGANLGVAGVGLEHLIASGHTRLPILQLHVARRYVDQGRAPHVRSILQWHTSCLRA